MVPKHFLFSTSLNQRVLLLARFMSCSLEEDEKKKIEKHKRGIKRSQPYVNVFSS